MRAREGRRRGRRRVFRGIQVRRVARDCLPARLRRVQLNGILPLPLLTEERTLETFIATAFRILRKQEALRTGLGIMLAREQTLLNRHHQWMRKQQRQRVGRSCMTRIQSLQQACDGGVVRRSASPAILLTRGAMVMADWAVEVRQDRARRGPNLACEEMQSYVRSKIASRPSTTGIHLVRIRSAISEGPRTCWRGAIKRSHPQGQPATRRITGKRPSQAKKRRKRPDQMRIRKTSQLARLPRRLRSCRESSSLRYKARICCPPLADRSRARLMICWEQRRTRAARLDSKKLLCPSFAGLEILPTLQVIEESKSGL